MSLLVNVIAHCGFPYASRKFLVLWENDQAVHYIGGKTRCNDPSKIINLNEEHVRLALKSFSGQYMYYAIGHEDSLHTTVRRLDYNNIQHLSLTV